MRRKRILIFGILLLSCTIVIAYYIYGQHQRNTLMRAAQRMNRPPTFTDLTPLEPPLDALTPLSIFNWEKVPLKHEPYWGIANLDVDPYLADTLRPSSSGMLVDGFGASISPDGKSLLVFVDFLTPLTSGLEITNLATGEVGHVFTSDFFGNPEMDSLIRTAFWDPTDPTFIFAGDYRFNTDGSRKQRILNGKRRSSFGQPTPDGTMLPILGKQATWLQPRTFGLRKRVESWPTGYMTISPDGKIVQGWDTSPANTLEFRDFTTGRLLSMVKIQAPFSREKSKYRFGGIPHWLSDSSGILITAVDDNNPREENSEIWLVKLTGEMKILTDKMEMIASSDNGRHWLFLADHEYYLVHTE